ncbi:phosphate transporter [Flammula alnicola]|nr:phosphate transporter [Flammula alnicola]
MAETAHPITLTQSAQHRAELEEFEREDGRPAFVLTFSEVKLLGIAGVGFFLDAYDLFIINPVTTMLQYRLYEAGANIRSVIGQFAFGYAADSLGRKAVYGKELMLIILATILTLTTPTGTLKPDSCLIYLGVFHILLGIGVGGDYPMSASITSDRANIRKRGTMLAYIFSNQGWGSFVGSLATIIVLVGYKGTMENGGHTSKVDGGTQLSSFALFPCLFLTFLVWRIVVGISLIPAFGALYHHLTLPESTRYLKAQKMEHQDHANEAADDIDRLKQAQCAEELRMQNEKPEDASLDDKSSNQKIDEETAPVEMVVKKPAHFKEFLKYFSEWRHAKLLIGTCMCWFLLDIAFYGINLNQNIVLQQIGYDGKTGTPWNRLFKVSTGGMIITALGFVPGYFASVLTIELLGRKWIQVQGFLLAALFLGILADRFYELSKVSFIVCFAFLQFFFNFGANTTTYCYPAEVFPTRFRATAHGISTAAGKCGAIISALAFNTLSKRIGTPAILWIFVGCCIFGAFFTLLLPEVMDRDPDTVLAEELRAKRQARKTQEANS